MTGTITKQGLADAMTALISNAGAPRPFTDFWREVANTGRYSVRVGQGQAGVWLLVHDSHTGKETVFAPDKSEPDQETPK
jgi:hypothetical protein